MATSGDETPLVVKAGAGAIAGALGASIGGFPGAVVGAASLDYVMHVAEKAWTELRSVRQRNIALVLSGAAETLGADPEEVVHVAASLGGGPDLLNDALLAAGDTLNQQKVRALSRALANGLENDGARIDESRLIVGALAQLEEPHVKVLTAIEPAPTWTDFLTILGRVDHSLPVLPVLERLGLIENNDDDYLQVVAEFHSENTKYEFAKDLAERLGSADVHGVPAEPSDAAMENFPTGYQRTSFGESCLEYLTRNDARQERPGA